MINKNASIRKNSSSGGVFTAVAKSVIDAGGVVFGFLTVWFLRRVNLSNAPLYAILLLSVMFFSYTVTAYLSGNGYLAVYIAGIIIGNRQIPYKKDIFSFFDGITWLVQIIMFVILGLLVNPHDMMKTAFIALMIGLFMIMVARPLSVFIALAPFRKIGTNLVSPNLHRSHPALRTSSS